MTIADDKIPTPEQTVEHVSNWWQSDWTKTWLFERPIMIAVVIVIAFVAHWALRKVITKAAHNATTKSGLNKPLEKVKSKLGPRDYGPELEAQAQAREARRVSRIQTLARVAKSAAAIFVWSWAILAILSQLDINVAPLVASAGVAGVALGFGAQSLVKDFLSGIFMLIEDQYGIGDCIDLGDGVFGDVEDVSLRITTLRDIDGALWFVRNGEILKVANHSSDFSIARLQIPVSLSNDADATSDFIRRTITEAVALPGIQELVLDDPNFQGMSAFEKDYASYRVSIKTLPGRQWEAMRAIQGYVWGKMAEEGIATPYPHGIGNGNGGTVRND